MDAPSLSSSVLMVDDTAVNLVALEAVLKPLGRRLVRATSGAAAIELADEEEFACILLDVQMPRIDGFEAARQIRLSKRNASTPIIFVTAIHRDASSVQRGYDLGAFDYIEKPFEPAILRAKVAALLDLREQERALAESEERFRRAFDDAPIGMALVDLDGRFLRVNPALEALTGHDAAWLLERTHKDLTHPDDLARDLASARRILVGESDYYRFEKRITGARGSERWVRGNVSLVRDADGTPRYFVHQIEDFTARKHAEDELARAALHDTLTGLANHTLFSERLQLAIARLRRSPAPLGVVFVDLDRFKAVNDRLGHRAGDRVLVEVAARLEASFRATDTVARLGGDHFCVLCDTLDDALDVDAISERVRAAFDDPIHCGGVALRVSACIGVAVATDADADVDADGLLRDAETAMHRAKADGPNASCMYDAAMQAAALERRELEANLDGALERGEFALHYQPKVDLATGATTGVEALVRWERPGHGLVFPETFIPIAETTGIIIPLGKWILEEACRQTVSWIEDGVGPAELSMGVNLSALQLADPRLPDMVAGVLSDTGLDPARLDLEITESILMEDSEANIGTLRALKAVGCSLSIDDFGTGYSSLNYLKRFPVDVLKIDRSFVAGVPTQREDTAIVAAILALAEALQLSVVAEGVETAEQRDALLEAGCPSAQGFLYARPAPAATLTGLWTADQPVARVA